MLRKLYDLVFGYPLHHHKNHSLGVFFLWAFFGVEIRFIVKVGFYSKPANLEIVFFKTAMRSLYCDKSLDTNNF